MGEAFRCSSSPHYAHLLDQRRYCHPQCHVQTPPPSRGLSAPSDDEEEELAVRPIVLQEIPHASCRAQTHNIQCKQKRTPVPSKALPTLLANGSRDSDKRTVNLIFNIQKQVPSILTPLTRLPPAFFSGVLFTSPTKFKVFCDCLSDGLGHKIARLGRLPPSRTMQLLPFDSPWASSFPPVGAPLCNRVVDPCHLPYRCWSRRGPLPSVNPLLGRRGPLPSANPLFGKTWTLPKCQPVVGADVDPCQLPTRCWGRRGYLKIANSLLEQTRTVVFVFRFIVLRDCGVVAHVAVTTTLPVLDCLSVLWVQRLTRRRQGRSFPF